MHRTREVIELPLPPAEVVEQVFMARMCALCGQRWLPRDQLKGLVVGRQRFGVNLVSLIVTLREEGRLPIRSKVDGDGPNLAGVCPEGLRGVLGKPTDRYFLRRGRGKEVVDEALER